MTGDLFETAPEIAPGKTIEERAPEHNPDGVPAEQIGAADGFRLLEPAEIEDRVTLVPGLEIWDKINKRWAEVGAFGGCEHVTYRTKLSKAELATFE